jgi:probable HAF family extracellular repeat protein
MTDLGTLGGPYSSAYSINDNGQIVGESTNASGYSHAFLWQNDIMTDLGTLTGRADSSALSINNAGQIVGKCYNVLDGYAPPFATLWIVTSSSPVANFTSNITSGFIPLTVQFTDLSQNATGWYWDFGDGTNSSTQNPPPHTFYAIKNYTVNLTVSNDNGTDSKLTTINVTLPPFPGCKNPPTDPNHDGLYEDINGNGRVDFADVVTYYNNMDWIRQNSLTAYYDYNHNSRIDFGDVVMLYNMVGKY